MLLIVAALAEELEVALSLCSTRTKVDCGGVVAWVAAEGGKDIHLCKTGVGPKRSAYRLERILTELSPSHILVIGYAGALHPELKLGDLAIGRRASAFGESKAPLEKIQLIGAWELAGSAELLSLARGAGLPAQVVEVLTSPYIIGAPDQKHLLHQRFHASAIDMETASLARVAAHHGIPISCVRAVSDEADDMFLAPFSYEPASTPVRRAMKFAAAGHWFTRRREWRQRSVRARESLRRFLSCYLQRPPTIH
jgi:adenosylhomocysteine nucleosidase